MYRNHQVFERNQSAMRIAQCEESARLEADYAEGITKMPHARAWHEEQAAYWRSRAQYHRDRAPLA